MKRHAHAPLTTLLFLCALAPLTLARCGGSASDGNGDVLLGTETGNPPVIEKEALHLEVAPGGMRLIGTAGAVTPGAEVRVTSRESGETTVGAAAADGSIDLLVAGNTSDTYEVTVVSGGREASISLSAADLPDELSTLSCDTLLSANDRIVSEAFAAADVSCSGDSDCVELVWNDVSCVPSCPYWVVASAPGRDAASDESDRLAAGACSEIERRDCPIPVADCESQPLRAPRCEQGQCVERRYEELSCNELRSEAIRRRRAEADQAPRECAIDEDCALSARSMRCVDDCNGYLAPIAASAYDAVERAHENVEEEVCGQFERAGCVVEAQPCVPPLNGTSSAVCVQGQCEVRFERAD